VLHYRGARKKKLLTDPVKIIPFTNQDLRKTAKKATVKPKIKPSYNKITEKETPKVLKAPSGSLSTSNLSVKKMMTKKEETKTGNSRDLSNMPRNDYDIDDLKMLWRRFAFSMKNQGKLTFYNALIKREPKFNSENLYSLEVDGQSQIDYIKPMLSDMVEYIRKELKNYEISFELILTTNPEEEVKFQTGKDRFSALARKNPNLHSLKNLFNLDIEF
tara:strand:- start:10091 stop:10741 length:651 start_codon:yes stop_codon:yes gene_type:complete